MAQGEQITWDMPFVHLERLEAQFTTSPEVSAQGPLRRAEADCRRLADVKRAEAGCRRLVGVKRAEAGCR